MQRTDLIVGSRDVTPPSRGSVSARAHHYSGEPVVTHKFHYTPDARRRKISANTRVQATTDSVRARQRLNASVNAYKQFEENKQRQFTPQEVEGYAQWILQADQLLESMRRRAETGNI